MRIASLLAVAVLGALAQAPPPQISPAEREAHWRQDLEFFVAGFGASGYTLFPAGLATRGQKDFSKLYPPASFERALAALRESVPNISDAEVVLRLMRLVASANVAHTTVETLPAFGFFRRLPLTLYWYSDGLAVTGAAAEYADALGARILSVGKMTPEELLEALAPYISHENDVWLRELAPGLMVTLAVVQHFGLAGPDGRVTLTLAKPGGAPFTLAVAIADPRVTKLTFAGAPLRVPVPLFLSHPGSYYWFQYLADSQTLYIQYNRCANNPKLPFSSFVHRAMAEADAHSVKRVVVDLRLNGGGDSRVVGSLKSALASRSKLRGRVFVLTGPSTFSSAMDAALDLRNDLHATLVGEPLGEKPNGYGDIRIVTLPNSHIKVQYSTKYFRTIRDTDPLVIEPDVAAPRTLVDALAGRDPALDAAVAARLPETLQ